jgi:hypothetical protein
MLRALSRPAATLLVLLLAIGSAAAAELFSKTYVFKEDVIMQVGVDVGRGVRLERIYFRERPGGRSRSDLGLLGVDVGVTNTADESRRVAVAVALFDAAGRLLGVATAGERDGAMAAGKERVMVMSFAGVGAYARSATTFQISVEVD